MRNSGTVHPSTDTKDRYKKAVLRMIPGGFVLSCSGERQHCADVLLNVGELLL